ncbi:MAG: hypothetical protein LRY27_01550 [Chitinophagales bacterium]|nr:hypothetical protein [Chitinophagales bacterium]
MVYEEDGEAAILANVYLYYKDTVMTQTSTDFDGKFKLTIPDGLESENLKLKIRYIVYEDDIIDNIK